MNSKKRLVNHILEHTKNVTVVVGIWLIVASLFLEVLVDIRDIMLERDGKAVPED
jgi:hypothetical protein